MRRTVTMGNQLLKDQLFTVRYSSVAAAWSVEGALRRILISCMAIVTPYRSCQYPLRMERVHARMCPVCNAQGFLVIQVDMESIISRQIE